MRGLQIGAGFRDYKTGQEGLKKGLGFRDFKMGQKEYKLGPNRLHTGVGI